MTIQAMRPIAPKGAALQQILDNAFAETGVPGASLAVWRGNDIEVATAGSQDLRTGVPVTPATKFQAGSITKPLVAAVVMMMVDRNLLDLDRPVADYLPRLHASGNGEEQITARHLLVHNSGLDGDFLPKGRAYDADPARYVELLTGTNMLHPAGAEFSYCNAGYVVLAHLIETLAGLPWDKALHHWLAKPLGMESVALFPDPASADDLAWGHVTGAAGPEPQDAPYMVPAAFAPAGSALALTAADLTRFASLYFPKGRAPDTAPVLTSHAIRAMCTVEVPLPQPAFADAIGWGLGWCIYRYGGRTIFGHDGDTVGHFSFLRFDPITCEAVALLTNGGDARALADRLFASLLPRTDKAGTAPVEAMQPPDIEPENYVGRYLRAGRCLDIRATNGGLTARLSYDPAEGPFEPKCFPLEPVARHLFRARPPGSSTTYFRFGGFDGNGRAGTVFTGYRLLVREIQ